MCQKDFRVVLSLHAIIVGKIGHFARECPYPKRNEPVAPQNQQSQKTNIAPPKYKKQASRAHVGRVHYTTMEEISEGELVTAGMFSINQHPAIVLFDSRSSYSFISQAFC
jgi:hypothetical protein